MTIAGSGREREREARVGGDDHREEGVQIYIFGVLFWTDFCLEVREGSWDMKRKQPDQREKQSKATNGSSKQRKNPTPRGRLQLTPKQNVY